MTSVLGKLCSLVLSDVFGEVVAKVGRELHDWNGRTLPQLSDAKGLTKVKESLAVLIQHNLVTFAQSERSGRPEYTLHQDKV
jgi:hypothetical protein